MPQEKEVLLEDRTSFERLVAMEEWLEDNRKASGPASFSYLIVLAALVPACRGHACHHN